MFRNLALFVRSSMALMLAIVSLGEDAAVGGDWIDAGFESIASGPLASQGTRNAGWEIQRHGRPEIQSKLTVECLSDGAKAKSGTRCLALSIPHDTQGFEFVTVGQRVKLRADRTYEARVWVRWPNGPERVPEGADATSGKPSAIVSFWVRHRDGQGNFAGRDEWLFDNQWHQLAFRFLATDPDLASLIYVSLLPNQKPVDTTVIIDDFELRVIDPSSASIMHENRRGNLLKGSDFLSQQPGPIAPPWYFANIGGTGIRGEVVDDVVGAQVNAEGTQRSFRIAMNAATTNFESAQLWQHAELRQSARYEVSCRLRWDNFTSTSPVPIVNYGIYHEATRTWYGPVDQVLERSGDWVTYRFTHIPPFDGPWKVYIQLNGWGNFGTGVTVSCDDFQCVFDQ